MPAQPDALGYFLGGFVAGEGCFTSTRVLPPFRDGTERRRFVFAVSVADRYRPLLEALAAILGGGALADRPARSVGWQPTSTLTISSNRIHLRTTIPFADRYLLPSAKRRQYESWRDELVVYLEQHPTRWGRGPSTCAIEGCERPVRGRGLCRRHYYAATGN